MIRVSQHAIRKYLDVVKKSVDPEQEIIELFLDSEEEEMHEGLVRRQIDNPGEPAKYYRKGRWRFVVVEGTMVTMEVDRFTYNGIGVYKKNKRRRCKKSWKWTKGNKKK